MAAGIDGGVGPMGSGFAPIQIGQRREREECEGGMGIGLGFRGDMEREWAGQLVGPGLLGRSPGVLFFVSYFSVLFLSFYLSFFYCFTFSFLLF